MSYALPADMISRYDSRRLGQLVRDDGTEATPTELLTDTVLQTALDDGHTWINVSINVARRYQEVDLLVLTSITNVNRATLGGSIIRLNCDLAYGFLLLRRGFPETEVASLAPAFGLAMKTLDRLRLGEAVFPLDANIDAGRTVKNVGHIPPPISSHVRFFGIRNDWFWRRN